MGTSAACTIRNFKSQDQFATVESLGVTARSIAFHSPQSHEGEKCFRFKPALAVLGLKSIHDELDLFLTRLRPEGHKNAGPPQVAVVFWDFVLQNQMVPKRIPGQVGYQPVILMRVIVIVSEDEIRGDCLFQLLEDGLYFGAHKWHESVRERFQQRRFQTGRARKQRGRAARLRFPGTNGAEHDPVKHATGVLVHQAKDRAPTADFDIVRMAAQTQNLQSSSDPSVQIQRDHTLAIIVSESFAAAAEA